MPEPRRPRSLFARATRLESSRAADILRAETTGGLLLVAGAVVAIVWANSPWQATYTTLSTITVGPRALHLDLTLAQWAADGLLAIFFFVAGLEVKREFVAGDLRDRRRAALPVAAAIGGMAVPAAIDAVVNAVAPSGQPHGWAIPTATDIAFAVAILAVISTHLPSALRTFLLTLAVVDDLLAIVIIAVFYTDHLAIGWLLLAIVPIGLFGVLVRRRARSGWLLVPLAVVAWALVHASGVHATVAGVLLAFTVPVRRGDGETDQADRRGPAEHLEHVNRPISAGLAVPLFAFFAAGVTVGGWHGLTSALLDPVALGIVVGLVVGKTVGILGATWLLATFTRAELDDELSWIDVLGMAMLGGIGFTVSLLIGELAFGAGTPRDDHVKVGVLVGSLLSGVLATGVLRWRNRVHRGMSTRETPQEDHHRAARRFERRTDG